MNSNKSLQKLGHTARKLAKELKSKKKSNRKFKVACVFRNGEAFDINGHLLKEAFGHCQKQDVLLAEDAYFLYGIDLRKDALLHSLVFDLELVNDEMTGPRRKVRLVKFLKEMADYCLSEGEYNPKFYEKAE